MIAGGLITAIGYYSAIILPSMVLFAVGSGLITTFTISTPLRQWFGYQVLAGLGVGVGFQSGIVVVQTVLPRDWIPLGTACVQFFQSLGGALFIAVAQTVFQNGLIEGISRDVPGLDPHIFINSGASQVRSIVEQIGLSQFMTQVLEAYLAGLKNAYYITVACSSAAFVVALGLEWRSVKKPEHDDEKKDGTAGDVEPAKAAADSKDAVGSAAGESKAGAEEKTKA